MRLAGKVAIVTGAASGIGEASARLFAAEGASVVLADVNDAAGKSVAGSIGASAAYVHADVSRSDECRAMVADAVNRFGGLDILHANAGVEVDKVLTDTTDEDWDRVIGVNLKGVFLSCRAAIPALRQRGGGAIVITASVNGFQTEPKLAAYCASKGGAIMLARSIAIDYAADGIRANALCPGWVGTPMTEAFFADPEKKRHWSGVQPAGRVATPDEIARVAVFLASDDARSVTGSVIVADGGLTSVLNGHRFDRPAA
jgi:NAD(P)-dependent dehydrogenase (short-subunit alcohol dehydrogenase family)